MKIKRYIAVNMRAALAQVRSEQGPDAVILSSRRTEEGIEVIAAVDYDEALFADATRQRAATAPVSEPVRHPDPIPVVQPETLAVIAPPAPPAAPPRVAAPQPKRSTPAKVSPPQAPQAPQALQAPKILQPPQVPKHNAVNTPVKVAPPEARAVVHSAPIVPVPLVVPAADGDYLALRRELKDLKDLVRGELAHLSRSDKSQREPQQEQIFEALTAMDIADDVALALAKLTPRRTNFNDPSHIPLALLVEHMPVMPDLNPLQGGVVVVVGPTGAGKTTTIAKLAARWSMQHGSQDLALVSTDSYRGSVREQLMTYDRILRAPVHTANSGRDLAQVLNRLNSKKLILIDTAGMGPRDIRLAEQLATVRLGAPHARVLLTLPAHGEGRALEAAVRSFASLAPSACVLTKLDEAASLGAVISTTVRHKLPIAYLCNGQRVPQDLHAAHERRVWLVRMALKLRGEKPSRAADASVSRRTAQAHVHA